MVAAPIMVGAHLVATAVMIALLAYGEQVLWFLARFARPARWLGPVQPDLPAMRVSGIGAPRMPRARFAVAGWAGEIRRRGLRSPLREPLTGRWSC